MALSSRSVPAMPRMGSSRRRGAGQDSFAAARFVVLSAYQAELRNLKQADAWIRGFPLLDGASARRGEVSGRELCQGNERASGTGTGIIARRGIRFHHAGRNEGHIEIRCGQHGFAYNHGRSGWRDPSGADAWGRTRSTLWVATVETTP